MRAPAGLTLLATILLVVLCCSHYGQTPLQYPSTVPTTPPTRGGISADWKAKLELKRRQLAFRKLKDDSEKLATGSEELKEMIHKSNPHTYSLGIIKKAGELEKLARKIKNQIKRGFR